MRKEIKDLLQGLYGFYGGAESFSAEKLVSEVEMKKETDEGSQRVSHSSKFRKLLESRDCMELSTEIDSSINNELIVEEMKFYETLESEFAKSTSTSEITID
ncbi:hypothetical protein Q3G72_027264 [Acer saccharum]|nr:hypothetical protein Q3G72_027264 [Acer saccharum]